MTATRIGCPCPARPGTPLPYRVWAALELRGLHDGLAGGAITEAEWFDRFTYLTGLQFAAHAVLHCEQAAS
jgi:hypothetical protein